jgi:hypothetical protein
VQGRAKPQANCACRQAVCSHAAGAWLRAQVKLHSRQANCLRGDLLCSNSRRGIAHPSAHAACWQGRAVRCKAKCRHRRGCARAAAGTGGSSSTSMAPAGHSIPTSGRRRLRPWAGYGCLLLPRGRRRRCCRVSQRRARRRIFCRHTYCCIGEGGRGHQQAAAASW